MAQRLFSGQYGPLSQVDTRPIVQAGQAWGQAIQGTLENVGKAIEKHQLNKQWEAAEPKLQAYADSLNLPPDQRDIIINSIKRDKDAMSNGYTAITKAAEQATAQKGVQLAQQQIRQTMEDRKNQQLTQKISDLEQSASFYMSQGKEVPESIREALYRHNLNKGGSLEASAGRIMQGSRNIKQAQEVAELNRQGKKADIDYKKGLTGANALQSTINQMKLMQSLNPSVKPFVDQLENAQKEYDAVVNTKSIPVKGYGTFSLAELKALENEDEKKFKKVMKILQDPNTNTKYLEAVAAEQEMARRNQELMGGINVMVDIPDDKDSGRPEDAPAPTPTPPSSVRPPAVPSPYAPVMPPVTNRPPAFPPLHKDLMQSPPVEGLKSMLNL